MQDIFQDHGTYLARFPTANQIQLAQQQGRSLQSTAAWLTNAEGKTKTSMEAAKQIFRKEFGTPLKAAFKESRATVWASLYTKNEALEALKTELELAFDEPANKTTLLGQTLAPTGPATRIGVEEMGDVQNPDEETQTKLAGTCFEERAERHLFKQVGVLGKEAEVMAAIGDDNSFRMFKSKWGSSHC